MGVAAKLSYMELISCQNFIFFLTNAQQFMNKHRLVSKYKTPLTNYTYKTYKSDKYTTYF